MSRFIPINDTLVNMFDRFIHRWLRIPYVLNLHYFSRPSRPKATILLIHGLGTSWQTWKPLEPYLPKDTRVIAIDMLGFGNSPKPDWKSYDVRDQAASIAATLRQKAITRLDVIIGHSMGSLAAVELAKQHPHLSRSLILCSPPIYRPQIDERFHHPEKVLRAFYRFIRRHPDGSKRILQFADHHNIWPDAGFQADQVTADSFLTALNTAIINQTALDDVAQLKLPITILSGKLDPLIVEGNLKKLAKEHKNIIRRSMTMQGHEVTDAYAKRLSGLIKQHLAGEYPRKKPPRLKTVPTKLKRAALKGAAKAPKTLRAVPKKLRPSSKKRRTAQESSVASQKHAQRIGRKI